MTDYESLTKLQEIRALIEEFLKYAPPFDNDLEISHKLGIKIAELEDLLIHSKPS